MALRRRSVALAFVPSLSATSEAVNSASLSASATPSSTALSTIRPRAVDAAPSTGFPVRRITRGPKHHWFGYYDKFQFDPTGRYVLGMEVDFEHRSHQGDDVIRIGMVDLADGDRWIELGSTTAWNWQQGCMLQWVPSSRTKILWNEREDDQFVCRILDIQTRESRIVPHPIYSVSPDGKSAVTPDFRRIQDVRPGYGYAGIKDPYVDDLAPKDSGIFHIDLETGESKLIISLADISKRGTIPNEKPGIPFSTRKHVQDAIPSRSNAANTVTATVNDNGTSWARSGGRSGCKACHEGATGVANAHDFPETTWTSVWADSLASPSRPCSPVGWP